MLIAHVCIQELGKILPLGFEPLFDGVGNGFGRFCRDDGEAELRPCHGYVKDVDVVYCLHSLLIGNGSGKEGFRRLRVQVYVVYALCVAFHGGAVQGGGAPAGGGFV